MSNSKPCVSINMHVFCVQVFCMSNLKNLQNFVKTTHCDRLDSDILGSRSIVPKISPDTSSRSSSIKSLGRSHSKSKAWLPLAFVWAKVYRLRKGVSISARRPRGGAPWIGHPTPLIGDNTIKLFLHSIRATMVSTPLVVAGHRVPFTSSIAFIRRSLQLNQYLKFFFFSRRGRPFGWNSRSSSAPCE